MSMNKYNFHTYYLKFENSLHVKVSWIVGGKGSNYWRAKRAEIFSPFFLAFSNILSDYMISLKNGSIWVCHEF